MMKLGKIQVGVTWLLMLLGLYFLVVMEWLFFFTKPSFLSSFTILESIEALFVVGLAGLIVSAFLSLIMTIILLIISLVFRKNYFVILLILPAFILFFCAVLLIDNFTNSFFGYGISDTNGISRVFYLLVFMTIFYRVFNRLVDFVRYKHFVGKIKILASISIVPVLASLIFIDTETSTANTVEPVSPAMPRVQVRDQIDGRPNIVFFATDGISADLISGYGNKNKTTPHLDQLIVQGLVAKNAFTNSERTTGSTTSMLTGKYPATTKVLFPPHVLSNVDAYRHLPGILKSLGYATFQETMRYYADANDLNFLQGFDQANGIQANGIESKIQSPPPSLKTTHPLFLQKPHASLLGKKIVERISQRLKHVFWLEDMQDVYDTVSSGDYAQVYGISDQKRVDKAIRFIHESKAPFFMHLHLMDSHCCNYRPKKKVFSAGQFETQKTEVRALLEDILRESDDLFGEIIQSLRETGKLRNTIIVYSSDHTENWGFKQSVPLVFIFPDGEYAGTITQNTQLLDVAPTILDYLDVGQPEWMEGQSLLSGSLNPYRPIYGITQLTRGHFTTDRQETLSRIVGAGPPNYGLNTMGLVVCDTWYFYRLDNKTITSDKVKGHTGFCDSALVPGLDSAKHMLIEHLQFRGFLAGE